MWTINNHVHRILLRFSVVRFYNEWISLTHIPCFQLKSVYMWILERVYGNSVKKTLAYLRTVERIWLGDRRHSQLTKLLKREESGIQTLSFLWDRRRARHLSRIHLFLSGYFVAWSCFIFADKNSVFFSYAVNILNHANSYHTFMFGKKRCIRIHGS